MTSRRFSLRSIELSKPRDDRCRNAVGRAVTFVIGSLKENSRIFGFPPKLYSRITRFQAALGEYGSGKSLTDIAYDCGYYDQSHFINDFREFSGYNPKVYFSGQLKAPIISKHKDCRFFPILSHARRLESWV